MAKSKAKPTEDMTAEERLEAMAEQAANYPQAWVPTEAGDTISGLFAGLTRGPSNFGNAPIVLLDCEGTLRSVWLFHTVLYNQFISARPIQGELVLVRYNGKREAKTPTPGRNSEYHDYRVVVDRPTQATTWDDLEPTAEPTANGATASDGASFGELPEGY